MLTEQKLFLLLIYTDAAILVLDSLMWLLDGAPGDAVRTAYVFVTALYYILNPVICLVWFVYVDFQIYKDMRRLRKVFLPVAVPAAASIVLSVVSAFNGLMFYLDDGNFYHRGTLFPVMALASFFYLIFAWIMTIIKRRLIPKHDLFPMAVFSLLPITGGIVQSVCYGLSIVWPWATFAILIIFVSFQNTQLYTDHLTGLNNRRQLDRFLQNKVQNDESSLLAGLMIDIDDFKKINDTYGHNAGDNALIDTSEILRKTFRKKDFISRFGGDEFVIVMAVSGKDDLQKSIDRLKENVSAFNAQNSAPYTISLSVGYDCFLDKKDKSAKEFISHIDDLMYRSKQTGSGE